MLEQTNSSLSVEVWISKVENSVSRHHDRKLCESSAAQTRTESFQKKDKEEKQKPWMKDNMKWRIKTAWLVPSKLFDVPGRPECRASFIAVIFCYVESCILKSKFLHFFLVVLIIYWLKGFQRHCKLHGYILWLVECTFRLLGLYIRLRLWICRNIITPHTHETPKSIILVWSYAEVCCCAFIRQASVQCQ